MKNMLNKSTLVLLLCFLFLPQLRSQEESASKIIIYRETNFAGSAISYKVFINKEMVVKLRNGSYYEYICAPGEYLVYLKENPARVVRIYAEEGKTNYIRFGLVMSFWRAVPELILVDESFASTTIANRGLRKIDENNLPFIRPANRIGLNMNFGTGIQHLPVITTSTGDNSNISFGGGLALGLKYGRELGKRFDLAGEFNYQMSMLTPALKNADITFSRWNIYVTPSLIIPIDGGDAMRFKAGAGVNYNWASKLEIECSEIQNGFNETWKYTDALGYHVGFTFELNYSEKWSTNLGLRYCNVNYEFVSGINHQPNDLHPDMERPSGAAVDFLFGLYYHF